MLAVVVVKAVVIMACLRGNGEGFYVVVVLVVLSLLLVYTFVHMFVNIIHKHTQYTCK